MKIFQKRPVAALIMVLAIILGLSLANTRRPDAPAPAPEGELVCVLHNEGGVLTEKTVRYIEAMNESLFCQTGAQIAVDVVETTGSQDIVDYGDDLFYQYGIGSRERDNGILMVLALKNLYNGAPDGDYYAAWGEGFTGSQEARLEDIFIGNMEADFAAKRYDNAVRKTFDALIEELENLYGVRVREGETGGAAGIYEPRTGYAADTEYIPYAVGNIIGLLILLFMVWLILDAVRYSRYRRYCRRYPAPPRYYPVFWGRPRRRVPPPPPPPGPGFGGFPGGGARRPGGGFHSGGSPGGGARRPSGGSFSGGGARRPGGGFHSGGSPGGGARRPSGGMKASRPSGGARRGGGSRPGGGARRR